MSLNEDNELSFESFLQKRKDILKLRWVTYWFRLQNTTLFFYTQKHGSALHLRGHYYMYTIQSVREVQNDDSKRFMFEIIMTNGKKKMLAADSAALRKEWVRYLWKAMHLSTSGLKITHRNDQTLKQKLAAIYCHTATAVWQKNRDHRHEVCEEQSINTSMYADVEYFVEPMQTNCSPPGPEPYSTSPTSEDPIYQNFHQSNANKTNEEIRLDGDYDVLPARNVCQRADQPTYTDEGEYDHPLSYRNLLDQENPYDVPSALLRKSADDCIDPEDGPYWKI